MTVKVSQEVVPGGCSAGHPPETSPDLPLRQRKGNHNDRADLGVFFGCGV